MTKPEANLYMELYTKARAESEYLDKKKMETTVMRIVAANTVAMGLYMKMEDSQMKAAVGQKLQMGNNKYLNLRSGK